MNVNAVQLDTAASGGPAGFQTADGYGDGPYGAGPYGDPTGAGPTGGGIGLLELGIAAVAAYYLFT